MENKIVTENVVVEHVAKNLIVEHVAVSGMLYVTVDKKLLYMDRFQDHVKVHIVFDNIEDEVNNSQQHYFCSPYDKEDEQLTNQRTFCEEEDSLTDDELTMKSGTSSNDININSHIAVPALAQDNQSVHRNTRNANNSLKMRTSPMSKSKPSVPKKRVPSRRSSGLSNNFNVKSIRSKDSEIEKIDFDEDCSDSEDVIINDQETQANTTNRGKRTEIEKIDFDEDCSDSEDFIINDQETQAKDDSPDTNEVISCPYCDQSFKSQKEFFNHSRIEMKRHPCPKCHRVLRCKAYLMIHMQSQHHGGMRNVRNRNGQLVNSEGKSDKCEICGSLFANLNTLKRHLMSHTSEFAYRCCVCPQKFRCHGDYLKHMRRHSKSGTIECKICKIRVNSRHELSKHRLTHPPHCGLCGQVFSSKTGRNFHYKTVHKNDILKCPQCDKLYSSLETLESHIKYHQERKKTQCPFCGLFFLNYHQHISTSHPSEKNVDESIGTIAFVCDKCPKQFKNKRAFERHSKRHSKEKFYKCPECSKQFACCGGLNRHMVIHTEERPYVCDVCGKACNQKGNLRVHMQIHKKAGIAFKVLECNQCGTSFSQKNALQEHIDKEHHSDENVLQFPPEYFQMNTSCHGQRS